MNDIQSQVRRLAAEKNQQITADDFFQSEQFRSYAQSLVKSVTGRHGISLRLVLYHGSRNGDTAYTDGDEIVVNTAHQRVYYFGSLYNRFLSQIGGILHECSHVLYADFDTFKKQGNAIREGYFLDEPHNLSESDAAMFQEMKDALAQPQLRCLFMESFRSIYNSLQDGHDEDAIMANFPPLISQCILMRREAKRVEFPAAENMINEYDSELEVVYSILLETCLFEDIFMVDSETAGQYEPIHLIRQMMPDIHLGKYTDDAHIRGSQTVKLMIFLWPYIKKQLEEEDSQQQSKGNGNEQGDSHDAGQEENRESQEKPCNEPGDKGSGQKGQPSSEAIGRVLQKLKAASKAGTTQAAANRIPSRHAVERQRAAQNNTAKAMECGAAPDQGSPKAKAPIPQGSDSNKGNDTVSTALNTLLKALATEKAEQELQKSIASRTEEDILAINQNSVHTGIPFQVHKITDVTAAEVKLYEELMAELKMYSKRLQKQMLNLFRDMREGTVSHHRSFGSIFEASEYYRPDQKFFASKKFPQEWPDMAISILVDLSGSMGRDSRIENAMKAVMLLHDFATNLGIPVEVSGHNASSYSEREGTCHFYHYTNFNQVSQNEKYRLAKLSTNYCNRDGMAIKIAANRISRRTEEVKLLIILSDGKPNHINYGGSKAADDIKQIVGRYRKRGVEVVAAAIGDDKDKIKEIYGPGSFLDISDLEKLPKVLVGLVKKRMTA